MHSVPLYPPLSIPMFLPLQILGMSDDKRLLSQAVDHAVNLLLVRQRQDRQFDRRGFSRGPGVQVGESTVVKPHNPSEPLMDTHYAVSGAQGGMSKRVLASVFAG